MNIYQLARERSAKFDERALAKPAEIALEAKKTRDRKWREANPDKVEAMRERDRERDKTPERKALHKAWAQSPAGKESERRRSAKYYATEKAKKNALKKSKAYYERHKDEPDFKARQKAARKAWAARNPEKAREVSRHSQAVFVGKRKQKRLGGEHVLALMGITLKIRMVA